MTAFRYKFEKILSVREKEKADAESLYGQAVKKFEDLAESLYKLLKEKEDIESSQREKLKVGISIIDLRHMQELLINIEKTIAFYQKKVIVARQHMEKARKILIDRNIEVKKYIKIKEKEYGKYVDNEKAVEAIQMDDISIQTYLAAKKG